MNAHAIVSIVPGVARCAPGVAGIDGAAIGEFKEQLAGLVDAGALNTGAIVAIGSGGPVITGRAIITRDALGAHEYIGDAVFIGISRLVGAIAGLAAHHDFEPVGVAIAVGIEVHIEVSAISAIGPIAGGTGGAIDPKTRIAVDPIAAIATIATIGAIATGAPSVTGPGCTGGTGITGVTPGPWPTGSPTHCR